MDKKSVRFVVLLCAVALVSITSFMWLSLQKSPMNYFELFSDAGFTLVRTKSRLNLGAVTWTDDVDRFVDGMLGYSVKLRGDEGTIAVGPLRLRDFIIYWYKDSGRHVFYYIDIYGRAIAFRP